jgi:hypothetical protein
MRKREFTCDELMEAELIGPIEQSSWRWGTDDDYVVPAEDGSHYLVTVRRQNEEGWVDEQFPVTGTEVEMVTVTVQKWIPVK